MMMAMVSDVKVILFCLSWALALPVLLGQVTSDLWSHLALLCYGALLFVILLKVSFRMIAIISLLLMVGYAVLGQMPTIEQSRSAGLFVLIFAAIIPTQAIMRAVAMTMPSVDRTQKALGELPAANTASGLQLVSHFLGGVINTGTFALIAASQPLNAQEDRRLIAALAALRGMNSSTLWSPFFVSFAVAIAYLPPEAAWGAIGIGIITSFLFSYGSMKWFAPSGEGVNLRRSLVPLQPIISRFGVVFFCVLFVSFVTGLTALHAVVATIPLLVIVQFVRRPDTIRPVFHHFAAFLKQAGDELLIISLSMMIAGLAGQSPIIAGAFQSLFGEALPVFVMIWVLPVIVWLGSLAGVHPVISSTPLLALFGPGLTLAEAALMMQAHMMGWCAGTMTSISSLSVLTVAEQFRLSETRLAYSRNMVASGGLAIIGGGLMAALSFVL